MSGLPTAWIAALTLHERLAIIRSGRAHPLVDWSERSEWRLTRWRRLLGETTFQRRLRIEQISDGEFRAALEFKPLDERAPQWWMDFCALVDGEDWTPATDATAVTNIFVNKARRRLFEGHGHSLDALSSGGLFTELERQLLSMVLPTIALEVNAQRMAGQLTGASAHERFANFCLDLSHRSALETFFAEYPVLARSLYEVTVRWIASVHQFLHACANDLREIEVRWFEGTKLGRLVSAKAAGDLHAGAAVRVAIFEGGQRIVFKPRTLAAELHFNALVCWANDRGWTPSFQTVDAIDRGAYGWSRYIQHKGCSTLHEVQQFYERTGGALALLLCVGGTDCHFENVIADGEYPYFIDLETVFAPQIGSAAQTVADGIPSDTVLSIGLLPNRAGGHGKEPGVDFSGLYSRPGQRLPFPSRVLADARTDRMRIVDGRVTIGESANVPTLHSSRVDVYDHRRSLMAGFERMYNTLAAHKDELLSPEGPVARFASDPVRVILRATSIYGRLRARSYHPDFLRDAVDRDWALEPLWWTNKNLRGAEGVISAERRDLIRGDIPIFRTTPCSDDLETSDGERLPNVVVRTGMARARQRIAQLGPTDRELQKWIISAAFAMNRDVAADTAGATAREEAIRLATSMGDRLMATVQRRHDRMFWLTIVPLKRDVTWRVAPAGPHLYEGTAGVALFLCYLGLLTNNPSYEMFAREAARSVVRALKSRASRQTIGAFTGISGSAYVLMHIGRIWQDDALVAAARAATERVRALVHADRSFDVVDGAAGAVLCLLSLHAEDPQSSLIETATAAGQHLLDNTMRMPRGIGWPSRLAKAPLTGLGHGTAGIAWALAALATVTGDRRFLEAAQAALEYERSQYLPEYGNWLDLRTSKTHQPDAPCMVAWCTGAVGIGLARLQMLSLLADTEMRHEVDIALTVTIAEGFDGPSQNLCHGDFGNIELLWQAADRLNRPYLNRIAGKLMAEAMGRIAADGPRCSGSAAAPLELPGFMNGIAGIGYNLLRFAHRDRLPSILTLGRRQPSA